MRAVRGFLVFLALAVSSITPAFSQPLTGRVACTVFDDFETGEMQAWESYPYAQDIGYEPFTTCFKQPAYKDSKFSLGHIQKPNDALDLSEGFAKRLDLWTTSATRLDFALFLTSDRQPEKCEVMLGTFDGRLYKHTVRSLDVNRWLEIEIPLDGFALNGKALAAGEHIEVVALKVFYPIVSHLPSYNIYIDDFTLTGERSRQFIARTPGSTWFEHYGYSVLNKHFAPGETISLSVAPEGMMNLDGVTCDLMTPGGQTPAKRIKLYDDGTNGDQAAHDGVWSNNRLYAVRSTDPKGQWTARISGSNNNGEMSWPIRFIVPTSRRTSQNHPRLFFTTAELKARLAGPESDTAKRLLKSIESSYQPTNPDLSGIAEDKDLFTESLTGGPYFRGYGNWRQPQAALSSIIQTEAWRYALTGDREAAKRGTAALLKLCGFSIWNHPWQEAHGNHYYFPAGYTVKAAGIGYDLLHSAMTEEERAFARKAIMDLGIKQFYRDMVEMNRMPSGLSNHIAVIVAGMGLAAAAIGDDDPNLPDLEPYLSGILAKMKQYIDRTILPEGSYGEPYTYQAMAVRDLAETLFALERNYGVDYTSTTYMKDFYVYPLYATHSSGRYQDLGDVSPTYNFTAQPMQWLVHRLKDPFMYDFVKPMWNSGKGGPLGYLWYTEGITPKKRDTLPTSKMFDGKGNMIMRSSWDDSGSILIFKSGPNANHYHYDQGTILLQTNGEALLSDAGHSNSYYANLVPPCYYTQAIGHNCLLVDMNPESQEPADYENGIAALRNWPKMIHSFAGEIADAAEGDLTSVYKGGGLGSTRTILSTKSGPVFLFDRVKSPEDHAYNWLFHAEHTDGARSISYANKRLTITRPRARLTMDIISPDIASTPIKNSDRDESFIALNSRKMKEATFLAVMMPEGKAETAPFKEVPDSEKIEAPAG